MPAKLPAARTPAQYLRKAPRQRRSQVLFDRILSAAKRLFEENGYAYISTNHIAEAANISIGSLYQYFPNCEAIALAIYEEASARATLEVQRRGFEILGFPLDKSLPIIIDSMLRIFEADRYVLLHLIDEVPELRQTAHVFSFDNLIKRSVKTYLEQHYPDASRSEIERKGYLIEKCTVGTVRAYLQERPNNLSRRAIVSELTMLVQAYLATIQPKPALRPPNAGSRSSTKTASVARAMKKRP